MDDELCPAIPVAAAAEAKAALRAASPGIRDPAGELVAVAPDWESELDHDPERLALVPAALAAIERAAEIWRFAGADGVEHQPHLLWCRPGGDRAELVVAGTRRIDGRLHLHTWFRLADPREALSRYWLSGALVHPVRSFRPVYAARRDVLYLHPDPHVPYRVIRIPGPASAFAYVDARVGFPSLVGFELQDARRMEAALDGGSVLANLLITTRLLDDVRRVIA